MPRATRVSVENKYTGFLFQVLDRFAKPDTNWTLSIQCRRKRAIESDFDLIRLKNVETEHQELE